MTPEVANAVFERDHGATLQWLREMGYDRATMHRWFLTHPLCVAPLLDRSQLANCWGRSTLDHIHDEMGVGKRRAKSDPAHLVTLCQGHTEDGRKAGYQWNTAHRPELRGHIRKMNESE